MAEISRPNAPDKSVARHATDQALTTQAVRDMLHESVAYSAGSSQKATAFDIPQAQASVSASCAVKPFAPDAPLPPVSLQEHERAYIQSVIALAKGKLSGPTGAASLLGIPRSTLQHRMRKLGIQASGNASNTLV